MIVLWGDFLFEISQTYRTVISTLYVRTKKMILKFSRVEGIICIGLVELKYPMTIKSTFSKPSSLYAMDNF